MSASMDLFEAENSALPAPKYNEDLRADVHTVISNAAPKADVHKEEWAKVMAGEPAEINPSAGSGFKVMTVKEYTSRWKRNDDFPDCLSCGSLETKEHHFVQSWCRGRKRWESETFCCQCHAWNWRSYADPEFLMPEDFERLRWEATLTVEAAKKASHDALRPGAKVAGAVKAAA